MAAPRKNTTTNELTLAFEVERETKGTYRFKEIAEEGVRPTVGTLYVTKDALASFGNDVPEVLAVTISVG